MYRFGEIPVLNVLDHLKIHIDCDELCVVFGKISRRNSVIWQNYPPPLPTVIEMWFWVHKGQIGLSERQH